MGSPGIIHWLRRLSFCISVRDGPFGEGHMSWTILLCAGIFEVCFAVGLKAHAQSGRLDAAILSIVAVVVSMSLLAFSMKDIPLGTAYAVWTGIGAVGACVSGVIAFSEPLPLSRIVYMSLLVAALVGLKFTTPTGNP